MEDAAKVVFYQICYFVSSIKYFIFCIILAKIDKKQTKSYVFCPLLAVFSTYLLKNST